MEPAELLERDTELAQLHRAAAGAVTGHGCTLLVSGEAGIGKTALVERFARELGARMRVLRGACEATFTPRPLGPFYDIALAAGIDRSATQADAFHALLDVLRGAPSVLIVEDAHWADLPTLDFIRFLGRRIAQLPVALVITYRDDEVGAAHPLATVVGELPTDRVDRLRLAALSPGAVATLARATGRAPAEVYRITAGNPLFVVEVLRSAGDAVAASVRDTVLARMRGLSGAARELVELVSIVPDRVELTLLEQASGAELDALDECTARGLLELRDAHVAFRHELTRLAIADALPAVRRMRLNRRVLEALAARNDDPALLTRLAHHAIAANDPDAILAHAPRAARAATERGAHVQAEQLLAAATSHAERLPPAERAAFFEQRAQTSHFVDARNVAVATSEKAGALWQAVGDRFAEGRNLVRRCQYSHEANHARRAEIAGLATRAVALLEPFGPTPELAIGLIWRGITLSRADGAQARECLSRALAVAAAIRDPDALIGVLCNAGNLEQNIYGETSRALIEQIATLARANGNDRGIVWAHRFMATSGLRSRDLAAAERAIDAGLKFAGERQLDRYSATYVLKDIALELDLHRGRWQALDVRLATLLASDPADYPQFMHRLRATGMHVRAGRPEADAFIDELAARAKSLYIYPLPLLYDALCEHPWFRGDGRRAAAAAREYWEAVEATDHPWNRGAAAFWLWVTGQLDPVPDRIAEPYRMQFAGDWRGAANAWKRLGYGYEEGRALMFGDEAAQREAIEILERLGAKAAAECCRRHMREQGIQHLPRGPSAATRANPFGLTSREFEILTLLAEGLPNADIARRLHRSVRTIDHHVAAVIDKVGARNRHDAVALARRHGLEMGN